MLIDFTPFHLGMGLSLLVVLLAILRWRRKSFSYLFCFSVFWLYLLWLVKIVVFPFYIATAEDLIYDSFSLNIHLIPFDFGTCAPSALHLCLENIYGNILLTVPFGFGIPLIARFKPSRILWIALITGLTLEGTQLTLSLLFKSAFRAIDINDVILNGAGVLLGYCLFVGFSKVYLAILKKFSLKPTGLFGYLQEIGLLHT